MGIGVESSGGIFKSVPPDGLNRPDDVATEGVEILKHATPSVGPLFASLEVELGDDFIPELVGEIIEEITDSLCKWISWDVKR